MFTGMLSSGWRALHILIQFALLRLYWCTKQQTKRISKHIMKGNEES